MNKKILVGKVTTVFGIKGEVKIESYCSPASQIEKYPLFDEKDQKIELKINNKNKAVIGKSGNGGEILIVKINDVNNRNDAENLKGLEIFAYRKDFKKTKKDEFYYSDLIGLDVINQKSEKIGNIIAINDFGAGATVEIKFLDEKIQKQYDDLENFPFKNEIFSEVNLEENFIIMII